MLKKERLRGNEMKTEEEINKQEDAFIIEEMELMRDVMEVILENKKRINLFITFRDRYRKFGDVNEALEYAIKSCRS